MNRTRQSAHKAATQPGGGRTARDSWRERVSPVTVAVALTSLVAATLFVVFDTLRTMEDVRRDWRLTGLMVAAGVERASLIPLSGAASQATASLLSTPQAQNEYETVVSAVGPRALGAYALAFIVTAMSLRRREPDARIEDDVECLIGAVPMGLARWDAAGTLSACNARYRAAIGMEDERNIHYHDAIKRLISGGYMKFLSDGENGRIVELHRKDGSWLLLDERPLATGGFVTMVTDITEQKQADLQLTAIREEQRLLARRYHEEKLKAEAASRSKTNFLAHLSHDIRTPLNHIIGFAELIGHETYGPVGDKRYLDYVETIKNSGRHLLESFATILDLAELEGGRTVLRSEAVDIDEMIGSVASRFAPQASRAGVRLERGEGSGVTLTGDRFCLMRMVSNVVENALRFTPSGGTVTLAAFAATDGVVIEVSDTGLGMSEERLASLTQPFALGDATFTREGVGPGLGIPIARAIAELSGGRMAVDSSPALGTTVAFSLPARNGAQPGRAAHAA